MLMKARTQPRSVYLKFRQPAPAGRPSTSRPPDGKVLAHDVGLGRLIAGTLHLDPPGPRAMADCRHPITEAGIGPLLNTLEARWTAELDPSEIPVAFRDGQLVGSRPCTRIEVTHTRRIPTSCSIRSSCTSIGSSACRSASRPTTGRPVRMPPPELVEEYTYSDLKVNVGLGDIDFDVSNEDYAFGRF